MKINLRKIANPYTVFGLAWSLCLALYMFGWAGIFPPLSVTLIMFLIALIVLFTVTSFFYNKIKPFDPNCPLVLNYKLLLFINSAIWLVTFLYSGIPITNGLRDDDFGIPLFKNVATSFNNFLSVYCFYLFLKSGKTKFIFYSFYCLTFYILAISRGNILMSVSTMFFLWLNVKAPVLTFKRLASILAGILLLLYLFGVAGNLRSIKDLTSYNPKFDQTYNSEIILGIGDASPSFRNSIVPNEYFWSYAYITSPLSNLQYNINNVHTSLTPKGFSTLVVNELMFDAISKKINTGLNLVPRAPDLIVPTLTVCTALTASYVDAGWAGMVIFVAAFGLFPILYTLLVQKAPLSIIGVSTLCTIYFFSIFDNMFILTGLTLQLFYPLLFMVSFNLKNGKQVKQGLPA